MNDQQKAEYVMKGLPNHFYIKVHIDHQNDGRKKDISH